MSSTIIASTMSMAGLGLFFAAILAIVNQKLKVKEEPKIAQIEAVLSGLNCGACGFASCHQYAEMLVKGATSPDMCKAGGDQITSELSKILGVEIEKKVKQTAVVHCGADASRRKKKAVYIGIKTCLAAHNVSGGENLCEYSCLGFGDCAQACPFNAITMANGLPRVDKDKCTACGRCVLQCPRDLITLEERAVEDLLCVACSNTEKGPETRRVCSVGCIACGVCQKLTGGIFHVEAGLARVRYDRLHCIANTDEVVKRCPTKCIVKLE